MSTLEELQGRFDATYAKGATVVFHERTSGVVASMQVPRVMVTQLTEGSGAQLMLWPINLDDQPHFFLVKSVPDHLPAQMTLKSSDGELEFNNAFPPALALLRESYLASPWFMTPAEFDEFTTPAGQKRV